MKYSQFHSRSRGFTMVEILVAISIITILSTIAVFAYQRVNDQVNEKRATTQIKMIESSLDELSLDLGKFDSNELSLYGLSSADVADGYPSGDGSDTSTSSVFKLLGGYDSNSEIIDGVQSYANYLDPNGSNTSLLGNSGGTPILQDPYGNPYRYRDGSDPQAQNPDFDLWSLGKDEIEGTPDDIKNW